MQLFPFSVVFKTEFVATVPANTPQSTLVFVCLSLLSQRYVRLSD